MQEEQEQREAGQVDGGDVGLDVEGEEEEEAEEAGYEVVEQVPREIRRPVDVGLDAADELQLLEAGLALLEQEHQEAGG